jgi:DNA (cytosine-5)-methyltransferase 1
VRVLDTFCKAGGAGYGYHLAGHEVVGVDIEPQPNYPFEFHQADALVFIKEHGHEFDMIHASPPCQGYAKTQRLNDRSHPLLIDTVRGLFEASGRRWVIENVEGARAHMRSPVRLCGASFGLRTYRHRLFETSWALEEPPHPEHTAKTTKMGRPTKEGEFMHVVGNFPNLALGRAAMGIPWMSRRELAEAIPPAYTEWIGNRLP